MSKNNGDKARFGRERKGKILRRKVIREFRASLENATLKLTRVESKSE